MPIVLRRGRGMFFAMKSKGNDCGKGWGTLRGWDCVGKITKGKKTGKRRGAITKKNVDQSH